MNRKKLLNKDEDYKKAYAKYVAEKGSLSLSEEEFKNKYNKEFCKYVAMYDAHNQFRVENEDFERNVWTGSFELFYGDYDFTNLISLILFVPDYLFRYLPWVLKKLDENSKKPVFIPEEQIRLDRNHSIMYEENYEVDALVARREHLNSLHDNYNTNKKVKKTRAEALGELRISLYSHNLKLRVNKIGRYLVFEDNMNDLLIQIFSNKILVEDCEVIEKKLEQLYQEKIKIIIANNL